MPIFTFVKRTERIFNYAFGYYKDFVHLQYLLRNAKLYSNSHTVNEMRRINLLFSSMFCIERKLAHIGAYIKAKEICSFSNFLMAKVINI